MNTDPKAMDGGRGRRAGVRRPGLAGRATMIGAATLLAACGGGDETVAMSEGQSLFVNNCATCHGASALGDGPMASTLPARPPALKEHLGHHSEAQLISLIRSGVPPAMPPAPLSEDQVRLVIDYLWTLVPESEVAALREMQRQAEESGGMMPGMGGMDHSDMPGMDHSNMPGMSGDSATSMPMDMNH